MKEQGLVGRVAALALALSVFAQAAARQQAAPARAEQDEEVVRITSNLIQVDAVVLDAEGRQVTDLSAEDFELSEDGRPQAITNFSYVDNSPGAAAKAAGLKNAAGAGGARGAAAVPPARVRPGAARRVVAFVVDDLGLSFQATAYVRGFLKEFVAKQMRPGDLVAVVRTSAGVGALQQFTSDPRLVERAAERVRYRPGLRYPAGSFAAPADDPGSPAPGRDALFTAGTLGALNYVLRGAAEMPGRKSV
ncbi:MAG TPA: VWA domain-containing protein, partial [Pyrinomonadaceae bacterium]